MTNPLFTVQYYVFFSTEKDKDRYWNKYTDRSVADDIAAALMRDATVTSVMVEQRKNYL